VRWFLSREGEFLHELFCAAGGDPSDARILWASRRLCIQQMLLEWRNGSLAASSFDPLKARDVVDALEGLGTASHAVCSKDETWAEFLARNPSLADSWPLAAFAQNSVAESRRDNWRQYLIEQVGDSREIFVYDVGWHGTMQYCLQTLVRTYFPERKIEFRGIYLGTFRSAFPVTARGLVCERESPRHRFKEIKLSVEVLEILLASPHGSVEGVELQDRQWVPIRAATHELGDGLEKLLRYRSRWRPTFEHIFFGACSPEAVDQLIRLLRAPSPAELELLGDLAYRSIGADDGGRPHFIAKPGPNGSYLLRPWLLLRDYKSAFWRLGFYRRLSWPCRVMLRIIMPRLTFSRV